MKIPVVESLLNRKPQLLKPLLVNDFVDALYMFYTPMLLAVFVLMTAAKTYFGNPISCLFSSEIDGMSSWKEYLLHYCLIANTYRYGDLQPQRELSVVNYYQWIPFFLTAQIVIFLIPGILWRSWHRSGGFDYVEIIRCTKKIQETFDADVRERMLSGISQHIVNLMIYENARRHTSIFGRTFYGWSTAALYVVQKILAVFIALGTYCLTSYFLGINPFNITVDKLIFMLNRSNSSDLYAGYFPTKVICHAYIIVPYATRGPRPTAQQESFQCILSLNFINEKIFFILRLWYLLLVTISAMNILKWVNLLIRKNHYESVVGIWINSGRHGTHDYELAFQFFKRKLSVDLSLLFRFIALKTDDYTVVDLMQHVLSNVHNARHKLSLRANNNVVDDEVALIEEDQASTAEPSAPVNLPSTSKA